MRYIRSVAIGLLPSTHFNQLCLLYRKHALRASERVDTPRGRFSRI
jgi:hypothetical protein